MKTADETEFRRAIAEFNDGRYFECHDTLEALWVLSTGEERRFLQGLIQVSVGFYHHVNGNPSGALSQWGRATLKLADLAPVHAGIDLEKLLGLVQEWTGAASDMLSGGDAGARKLKTPIIEIQPNRQRREPWPQ
jgi:predicted metal-dependent hydrolase